MLIQMTYLRSCSTWYDWDVSFSVDHGSVGSHICEWKMLWLEFWECAMCLASG